MKGTKNKTFQDVFSREFAGTCARNVDRHVKPRKDDPYVLGWSLSDVPMFTDYDFLPRPGGFWAGALPGSTLTYPNALRNLGAGAPGEFEKN